MFLRLILVGMVSAMGFNLPSARDWDDWTTSGRALIQDVIARVDDAMMPAGDLAFDAPVSEEESLAETTDSTPDWAFEAIVDQMAMTFEPAPSAAVVQVEPSLELPADVFAPVEPVALATTAPEASAADMPELMPPNETETTAVEVFSVEPEAPAAARISRIDLAVRLTREAVGAWTRVFQPAPRIASLSR